MKTMLSEHPATQVDQFVFFSADLPATLLGNQVAVEDAVRTWVRHKKLDLMKSFVLMDTHGSDKTFVVRVHVNGPPDFESHRALGALGFRMDTTQGRAYKLVLHSCWKKPQARTTFTQHLETRIRPSLPLSECRDVAQVFADGFSTAFTGELDFSRESLATVSQAFIQSERNGLSPVLFSPAMVIAAGCYFGDVLIRELMGCSWMKEEDADACNFVLGPARINPWLRVLDMCVRGTEASLTGCMEEVIRLYFQDLDRLAGTMRPEDAARA